MVFVVCVGCGEPKKSMGWYHLTHLLRNPAVVVRAVVEPWFLGPGRGSSGAAEFDKFQNECLASCPGIQFCASISELIGFSAEADVAKRSDRNPLLALIACRTKDTPDLMTAVCELGATHVFLEKPGAETTEQLSAMKKLAAELRVEVVVGYNRNVSQYVCDAFAEIQRLGDASKVVIELEHNNPFTSKDLLGFITGPGAEGMMHNMLCHELAIAVAFLGLTCKTVEAIQLDKTRSELLDVGGGSTDWERVAFCVSLIGGRKIHFFADRCGGNFSRVHVGDGVERKSYQLPSEEHSAWVKKKEAEDPELRAYFLLQDTDYRKLKGMLLDHMVAGRPGLPLNVVCLDGALEVLQLADMLAPKLKSLWDAC